tara:strand:+ start:1334 stop:2032 length:699 start_codon:yes stop_codon:yes gene_type:complete
LLDWEWKTKPLTVALYTHLMLSASFEENRWRGVTIKRGSLITGRKKLSLETGLTERQVRTALNHLKSTNEVTIKTTKEYSIITITNWEKYQASDQQNANERPSTDQAPTTTKEGKEGKEGKEDKKYIRDFSEAVEMYNSIGLSKVLKLTESRKKSLNARLTDCGGLEGWVDCMERVRASDFLMGRSKTPWKATFDFIITESKFVKIMEGAYDNNNQQSKVESEAREMIENGW